MATYYLDLEGGNDANDGTSFANRWLTITGGPTAARIAPGDTIRVMASPAPTSLGINGTWSDGPRPATKAIVSSTNATPIAMTVTGHGFSTGDTIQVASHTTNTNANGVWEITVTGADTFTLDGSVGNGVGGAAGTVRNINNSVVRLASSLTANISDCETAWTASANVTATLGTTDFKENKGSASIAVAAAFTTGKAAYFPTGTLNLSGYQQVSFWIKQTAGSVANAGNLSIRLCTDTSGAVSVHTCAVPALGALNQWSCVTVDLATNLNSAIQSVALYIDTDRAAQTFLLDNIIACKAAASADSLTLNSLIGKNTSGETWWGIQSINGKRVILDNGVNTLPTGMRGYAGTTETVTTYKREGIKLAMLASGASIGAVQDSGSTGSLITFEGGYDRTVMSSLSGETWIDGQNGLGNAININSRDYVKVKNLHLARFNAAFGNAGGIGLAIERISANNSTASGMVWLGRLDDCVAAANTNGVGISSGGAIDIGSLTLLSNVSSGLSLSGTAGVIQSVITKNNGGNGVSLLAGTELQVLTSVGNGTGLVFNGHNARVISATIESSTSVAIAFGDFFGNAVMGGSLSGNAAGVTCVTGVGRLRNVTITDSPEVSGFQNFANGSVSSENHDGVVGSHKIFTDSGLIFSQSATRHTASGIAWSMQPTSVNRHELYPLTLPLGPFLVEANVAVTVTCWFYRDNAGLTGRLVCKGGQLTGIAEVIASMSGSAGTWEQLSMSFTPTEAGTAWVEAQFFGGTTYTGTIDDLEISQGSNTFTISLDDAVFGTPFVWNNAQPGGGGGGSVAFSPFNSPVIRGVA